MSHPPECEIYKPSGNRCGRWVHEPDGPGSAKKVETRQGGEIWACAKCMGAAYRGKYGTPPHMNSTGIYRNDPCPCGSGRKFKKCCRLKA